MTHRCWELVDPRLAEPAAAASMQQILDLVRSDWTLDTTIDIGQPVVERLLADHRIATLIPLDRVPAAHRDDLRNQQLQIAGAQLQLRVVATELLELLNGADIETRVLKGLATAELDYPNDLLRHTGDVDLAVRPDRLQDTIDVLKRHGYTDRPNRFSRYLLYGWTLETPAGASRTVEVDLHTRLFRRSPLGEHLFLAPGERLEALPGSALPLAQRLVHAAGHFIISPPGTRRMSSLIDLTRMLQDDNLDLSAARGFAAALNVESLVGAGLRVEAELSGRTAVLAELDRWRSPDWLERATRLTPHRRLVLDHLARYREVPRGQRLRYLPAWLVPDSEQREIFARSARRAVARARDRVRR